MTSIGYKSTYLLSPFRNSDLFFSMQAYWYEDRDVADLAVLEEVAAFHGVNASQLVHSERASKILRANTAEAAGRGAFGVPR